MSDYRFECRDCGKEFPAASAAALYCSGRCKVAAFRRRRQAAAERDAARVRRLEKALADVEAALGTVLAPR